MRSPVRLLIGTPILGSLAWWLWQHALTGLSLGSDRISVVLVPVQTQAAPSHYSCASRTPHGINLAMSDHEVAEEASAETVAVLADNREEFLAFLERRVGNRAIAEDILQEAFARGVEKLGSLREEESAIAWFYRSLRNAVVNHRRRHAVMSRGLEAFAGELHTSQGPGTETHAAVCRCVSRVANALKPEYADALQRVDIEGEAVKEFATKAGIASNNAAVRLFRARAALRRQVQRCCGACAESGCVDCTCRAPEEP